MTSPIRVRITQSIVPETDAVRCRMALMLAGHNPLLVWFVEPVWPDEQTAAGAEYRAALAMMGLAQEIYEAAAKHLAEHPLPGSRCKGCNEELVPPEERMRTDGYCMLACKEAHKP